MANAIALNASRPLAADRARIPGRGRRAKWLLALTARTAKKLGPDGAHGPDGDIVYLGF